MIIPFATSLRIQLQISVVQMHMRQDASVIEIVQIFLLAIFKVLIHCPYVFIEAIVRIEEILPSRFLKSQFLVNLRQHDMFRKFSKHRQCHLRRVVSLDSINYHASMSL